MAGIGKQRERTCDKSANDLSDQHDERNHEYDKKPLAMRIGRGQLVAMSAAHAHLLHYADLSDSQRAIALSESDKSAKGRRQLVGDLRFAYGDPDPVCSEAGKGLAAAYRETVVPQREA